MLCSGDGMGRGGSHLGVKDTNSPLQALPTPKTPPAPTSGRQLLGVDDFGCILLSCQHLHASPDDGESAPGETGGR